MRTTDARPIFATKGYELSYVFPRPTQTLSQDAQGVLVAPVEGSEKVEKANAKPQDKKGSDPRAPCHSIA